MWHFFSRLIWFISNYSLIRFLSFFYFYLPLMLIWCWHFTFMCLSIYSCLYLQQFTTFILRRLHLLLIADWIERNIIVWFSSSHVSLISSIWHSMHLLHDRTVVFDTNDGSLLQISLKYLFIVYNTKLYFSYIHLSKNSDHDYNSASAIMVIKSLNIDYFIVHSS